MEEVEAKCESGVYVYVTKNGESVVASLFWAGGRSALRLLFCLASADVKVRHAPEVGREGGGSRTRRAWGRERKMEA